MRYTLLDPLRILASLSIVGYHAAGECPFGVGFGLPLFFVLMFALAPASRPREETPDFARRKASYLLVPWLRWSALLLVVLVLRDVHWDRNPLDRLEVHALFYGGHRYYWFLPFAAAAVVLARVIHRATRDVDSRVLVPALALVGAVGIGAASHVEATIVLPHPYLGWVHGAPALFLGLALGRALVVPTPGQRAVLVVLPVLIGIGGAFGIEAVGNGIAWRYGVALPLVGVAFLWRPTLPRIVPRVARTCFGIFLAHPLAIIGVRQVVDPAKWPTLVHVGLVWLLSWAIVLLLQRLRPRWQEVGAPHAPAHRLVGAPESKRTAA